MVDTGITLSVMLTCANNVSYIDAAIESVVMQELPFGWELLIGDDASTDGTLERVREWERRFPDNIVVFDGDTGAKIGYNKGFRAGLNRARLLDRARGRYLAFLDGDDLLLDRRKYLSQVEVLERSEYSACSCAAHSIVEVYKETGEIVYQRCCRMKPCVIDPEDYWRSLYFHTNAVLFRRECASKMSEDRYRKFLNDNLITFLVIQHGPIAFANNVAAQYNRTGTGLWTGMGRTYGVLRNLALYDLETEINPCLSRASFRRHRSDFWFMLRQHNFEPDERTEVLMEQHDENRFPTMWRLYRHACSKRDAIGDVPLIGKTVLAKAAGKAQSLFPSSNVQGTRRNSIERRPYWVVR